MPKISDKTEKSSVKLRHLFWGPLLSGYSIDKVRKINPQCTKTITQKYAE